METMPEATLVLARGEVLPRNGHFTIYRSESSDHQNFPHLRFLTHLDLRL